MTRPSMLANYSEDSMEGVSLHQMHPHLIHEKCVGSVDGGCDAKLLQNDINTVLEGRRVDK